MQQPKPSAPAVPTAGPGDGLWHIAANEAEDARAEAGQTWRTLCGQTKGDCVEVRPAVDAEPDDCLVCVSMAANR